MIVHTFKDPKIGTTTTNIIGDNTTLLEIDHAQTVDFTDKGMFIDGIPLEEYLKRKQKQNGNKS